MKINRSVAVILAFAFFVCACGMLGYAVLNLSLQDEMLPPDAPQRNETVSPQAPAINMNVCLLIYWLFLGFGIVGIFYLVAMRRGREVMHAFFGALLAVLILIGILYVMAVNNTQENTGENITSNSTGTPGNTPLPKTSTTPPLISMLLVAGMFVLIAVIIVTLLFSYLSSRTGRGTGKVEPFNLDFAKAIDEGIALFETGVSARDAIIRCYRRMTELLAAHGVKDALYLTPREFKEEVHAKMGFESKNLDALVELFETARYSSHPIGEAEREQALGALKGLRKEVEG
ncbi:MAG: DUF4129 domain-containing protein [Thermoplasmata archaeon]